MALPGGSKASQWRFAFQTSSNLVRAASHASTRLTSMTSKRHGQLPWDWNRNLHRPFRRSLTWFLTLLPQWQPPKENHHLIAPLWNLAILRFVYTLSSLVELQLSWGYLGLHPATLSLLDPSARTQIIFLESEFSRERSLSIRDACSYTATRPSGLWLVWQGPLWTRRVCGKETEDEEALSWPKEIHSLLFGPHPQIASTIRRQIGDIGTHSPPLCSGFADFTGTGSCKLLPHSRLRIGWA